METFYITSAMIWRFLSILLEFIILIVSAVFIYLEELFRLVVPLAGKSLEGEIVLVTGSANGLGKEICKELVKSKAKLVLWDVCEQENRTTAQELRDLGAEYVFEDTVDVSDRNQVVAAAAKVRRHVGNVTMLVNNAGICPMQQFLELTPDAVQATFQTNVMAHFWTLKEFLPNMVETNHGHIVTTCSTMGQMAIRGPAPYYATKHAVHGLIECLKDELAHLPNTCNNIKFTTAYPFFMNTRMVQGSGCGLHLKFKFPSITPFMEASYVAKRIAEGILLEKEYLYIPEHFRIYLAGKFFLPSKLHRLAVDFFVEESGYSVNLGTTNGSAIISPSIKNNGNGKYESALFEESPQQQTLKTMNLGNVNLFSNLSSFTSASPSWLGGNNREEKEK